MANKVEDQAPDVRDVFIGDTMRSFSHLAEQRIAITDQIKVMEEEKKRLDTELTALMVQHDVPKVLYDGRAVSLVQGSRSSLSKEKLLLAGVAATVIQGATDTTSFTYLLIGKAKG